MLMPTYNTTLTCTPFHHATTGPGGPGGDGGGDNGGDGGDNSCVVLGTTFEAISNATAPQAE